VGATPLNQAGDLRGDLDRKVSGQVRPGEADNDQNATGSHEVTEPEKSVAGVHVVHRGDRADQVEAAQSEVGGGEVPDDVPDVTGLRMIPAAPNTRLVPVQPDDFEDPASTEFAGEVTVAATDVQRLLASGRDGIEHQ
jgi:hypothetical protein